MKNMQGPVRVLSVADNTDDNKAPKIKTSETPRLERDILVCLSSSLPIESVSFETLMRGNLLALFQ